MIARLKAESAERQERLQFALATLDVQSRNQSDLARRIKAARTTWLVAGLVDGINQYHKPLPTPDAVTILATDGSHIAVDRHRSTRCYLINIGEVILNYGQNPSATLTSYPYLYSGEEELAITSSSVKCREQPIEGNLLSIKRGVDEYQRLATLAKELPMDSVSLALADGSLILWSLEAYPDFVTEALLTRGFLSYLTEIEKLNEPPRKIALASYISFPRSTEVINALRVALCPREIIDTDYCGECKTMECQAIAGIRDRELFMDILKPGERSALFTSGSRFVETNYGRHQVYFFYIRADDEIARIEIPRWVALDESLLSLTHSLVLDQCQRGQGYPVALSEAHERAVVTAADRKNFWQLLESILVTEQLISLSSAKSKSKRTRWV
jgi:hypothetical protein